MTQTTKTKTNMTETTTVKTTTTNTTTTKTTTAKANMILFGIGAIISTLLDNAWSAVCGIFRGRDRNLKFKIVRNEDFWAGGCRSGNMPMMMMMMKTNQTKKRRPRPRRPLQRQPKQRQPQQRLAQQRQSQQRQPHQIQLLNSSIGGNGFRGVFFGVGSIISTKGGGWGGQTHRHTDRRSLRLIDSGGKKEEEK